tara:strand:- start:366 stop:833 length:468 start_codon:yes stop_codon:yes gene_type:complete
MIKKIILLSFLLLFLNNCGYTPIYSKKSKDFQIKAIETSGEVKVNKLLYNKLKVYNDNPIATKTFNLNINSSSTKSTIAKDKKGNPTQFSIELSITLQITDGFNNKVERNFRENSAYDNNDNKFDLRKYEDNLIENMTEKIFSEIILFIQTGNLS